MPSYEEFMRANRPSESGATAGRHPAHGSNVSPSGSTIGHGMAAMLDSAMAAVASFQSAQAGAADEPIEGHGTAAEGRISVTAIPPGRLGSIVLDPRVLRLDSFTLAEKLTTAVNLALADLQSQASAAGGPADFGALNDQIREIRDNAQAQFSAFNQALVAAQQRLVNLGEG